jgi:hypothetical protein
MSDTQFRLLIKTTISKLEFKLSKSRALSTYTIQTTISQDLKNLAALPNESRSFERGLDILKMKLAQLVRTDRIADVWEDLIGELTVLESSITVLSKMMEDQRHLNAALQQKQRQSNGWFFKKQNTSIKDVQKEEKDMEVQKDTEEDKPLDRVTKVIRNVIIAQELLGDDVKELKKLSSALHKCIDKTIPTSSIPNSNSENLDLEDRVCLEITRKLNGVDEDIVVQDYLKELCDVYTIDLYNEGKYKDHDSTEEGNNDNDNDNDDDKNNTNTGNNGKNNIDNGIGKTSNNFKTNKKFDDLDDLKQRFAALKK